MLFKETEIKDVMTHGIIAIDPDLSLQDAGARMSREKVRHLLVMAQNRVQGMLSARDIINYYENDDLDPREIPVESAMQPSLAFCSPNAKLPAVLERMRIEGIHAIPVMDEDGSPLGMFTSADALRLLQEAIV